MLKLTCYLILVVGILACRPALAEQGYPPGQIPHGGTGMSTCGPIPSQQQAPPEPAYVPQWQAVAGDKTIGIVGSATGQRTEDAAKVAVLDDCNTKGGKSCEILGSAGNTCLAIRRADKPFFRLIESISKGREWCYLEMQGRGSFLQNPLLGV
ncbi:DUF4189 domain-containing protein [Luteibacter yeojuensis]|uniref:DUF4189 domain-containing protein n=1 Tax=Luteibacter yeojuensis TaxID=345309 RepID=UPI0018DB2060|nr:DUF4189 domain-containing protein [Luteibacter yeojuensis]